MAKSVLLNSRFASWPSHPLSDDTWPGAWLKVQQTLSGMNHTKLSSTAPYDWKSSRGDQVFSHFQSLVSFVRRKVDPGPLFFHDVFPNPPGRECTTRTGESVFWSSVYGTHVKDNAVTGLGEKIYVYYKRRFGYDYRAEGIKLSDINSEVMPAQR